MVQVLVVMVVVGRVVVPAGPFPWSGEEPFPSCLLFLSLSLAWCGVGRLVGWLVEGYSVTKERDERRESWCVSWNEKTTGP